MEMSIDNSLELFEDNFTVINTHGHYTEEEEVQATEIAIETMRKYQAIEQILKDIPYGGDATVRRIQEVIEDGRN